MSTKDDLKQVCNRLDDLIKKVDRVAFDVDLMLKNMGANKKCYAPPLACKQHADLIKDLLGRLPHKDNLEIEIVKNKALISYKGKFNKAKFNAINAEIIGYGGRYKRGYWQLLLKINIRTFEK